MLVIGGRGELPKFVPISQSYLSNVEMVTLNMINDECDQRDLGYKINEHASIASSIGVITCGGQGIEQIGDRCYDCIGGYKKYRTVSDCFIQTSKGEIRTFPSMAGNRSSFQMAIVNEILYAIGGKGDEPLYKELDIFFGMDTGIDSNSNSMETIKVETGNQWKQKHYHSVYLIIAWSLLMPKSS